MVDPDQFKAFIGGQKPVVRPKPQHPLLNNDAHSILSPERNIEENEVKNLKKIESTIKPEDKLTCQICHLVYKSEVALIQHKQNHHGGGKSSKDQRKFINHNKEDTEPVTSFVDLSFAEFSMEKFPLIASKWCLEHKLSEVSSSIGKQSFACPTCSIKFPCQPALMIHVKKHYYPTGINCHECDCYFSDESSYADHTMIKHIPSCIMNSTKRSDDDDKKEIPELKQEGFLSLCGLYKKKPNTKPSVVSPPPEAKEILSLKSSNNNRPSLGQPAPEVMMQMLQEQHMRALLISQQHIAAQNIPFGWNNSLPIANMMMPNNLMNTSIMTPISHDMAARLIAPTLTNSMLVKQGAGMKLPHILSSEASPLMKRRLSCKFCNESSDNMDQYKREFISLNKIFVVLDNFLVSGQLQNARSRSLLLLAEVLDFLYDCNANCHIINSLLSLFMLYY